MQGKLEKRRERTRRRESNFPCSDKKGEKIEGGLTFSAKMKIKKKFTVQTNASFLFIFLQLLIYIIN